MADNDLEIEGLIDSIRGHEPSQEQLDPNDGTAEFISVEEVMAGPSMAGPSPLLFGMPGPGYAYPGDPPILVSGIIDNFMAGNATNNITLQASNGPSMEISPEGWVSINDGHGHVTHINLREQAQTIVTLQHQVAMLRETITLLGTALNAQIDNEVMAGLSASERAELNRVLAERKSNQDHRAEVKKLLSQRSLFPTMKAIK